MPQSFYSIDDLRSELDSLSIALEDVEEVYEPQLQGQMKNVSMKISALEDVIQVLLDDAQDLGTRAEEEDNDDEEG